METKYSFERHAGRKIRIEAMRTFKTAELVYDLAPGEDGRWYLVCEMVDPPTWSMSWPSLEAARRFLDQMSVEDSKRMERMILEVAEKTGELIACDLGETNTVPGFLRRLDMIAAEVLNRGRLQ
jgi:hypothetical protein